MFGGVGRVGLFNGTGRKFTTWVAPSILRAPLTLTREQPAGAISTALDADGITWKEFSADVPIFSGISQRLRADGQRSNQIRNPRGEGIVGGAPPTFHSTLTATGLTAVWASVGKINGVDCWDINITGTTGSTSGSLQFDSFAVSAGNLIRNQIFAQVVGGSTANFTSINLRTNIVGGTGSASSNLLVLGLDTTFRWLRPAAAITVGAGATSANVGLSFGYASGVAIDITLRIGWPTSEIAAFPTFPILPATNNPALSTRGSDLISAPLSSVRLGANGAGTILGVAALTVVAPATADQTILTIGANNSNRYRMRNIAGGGTITVGRTTGGFDEDTASLGTVAGAALFRFGVTIDAAGRIAGCINGGTVLAATGGPTTNLATLRVGNNITDTDPLFGELALLRTSPVVVSDVELASLVGQLPT